MTTDTPPLDGTCPRCRARILEALICGIRTRITPVALTLHGQLAAAMQNRWLFALHIPRNGSRNNSYLTLRLDTDIAANPAALALAEHKCGAPLDEYADPTQQQRLDEFLAPRSRQKSLPETPPF